MGFRPVRAGPLRRWAGLAAVLMCLAGCQDSDVPKDLKPVPGMLTARMSQLGMDDTSPIFVRIYKESSELEVWKQTKDGTFALLTTYPICKWSGALGPKKVEGDRQAPEGFYTVTPAQMNPNSNYYLSFNIGYPNAYDRSLGRTGTNLMVHGACSSAGCYSMTDEAAGQIFALARDSFRGGQRAFEIQALPFHMTAANLAAHRNDPNMPFWRMLKVGTDEFDLTRIPPKVDVCDHRYVFNADPGDKTFDASASCPPYTVPAALTAALAVKQAADDQAYAVDVAADEAADQKAVADQQVAAQRAAAEQQREAERAAQPSLIQRMLAGVGIGSPPAPTKVASVAAPAVAPSPAPAPAVEASVPAPRLRPVEKPPAVDAAVEPASTGGIAPSATPPIPAVGKFVKKKVWWWDDQNGNGADTTTDTGDTAN